MENEQISWTLKQIAHYLEMAGENTFKVSAYRKAARTLDELEQPVQNYKSLKSLKGIGKATSRVINELLETGKSSYLQELQEKHPVQVEALLQVQGVGPKLAQRVYRQLGIHDLQQLEEAAETERLQQLDGVGPQLEQKILNGVRRLKEKPDRFPVAFVLPIVKHIEKYLSTIPLIERFAVAGSFRRGRETVKDLDFVIATEEPETVIKHLVQLPGIDQVVNEGRTKVTVEMEGTWPVSVDFRFVAPPSFATALHHFTGSAEHNVQLRRLAKKQGKKVTEYAIDTDTFPSEQALYEHLQIHYIPPEMREGEQEIELAQKGEIPHLIKASHIRADLHMHSTWSDGKHSILHMAEAARAKGYEYMAMTDHSISLRIAGGLSVEQLRRQREDIEAVNEELNDFTVLAGVEMDILNDGQLDFSDEMLAELDFVIGSIHSGFRQDETQITHRIMQAIEHPYVDMIAHPTGRLIGKREPYALNIDKMLEAAAQTKTIIECNANPNRLDLHAGHLRKAKEAYGVRLAINTDAHTIGELDHMRLGIKTARRGWLSPEDVVNTMSLEQFKSILKRNQ